MSEWIDLLSEIGFPIFVTMYLLSRIEAKLEAVNQSILMLPEKLYRP